GRGRHAGADAPVRRVPPGPVGVRGPPRGHPGEPAPRDRTPPPRGPPAAAVRSAPARVAAAPPRTAAGGESRYAVADGRPATPRRRQSAFPVATVRFPMLPTIEWKDDAVVMVDQRKLPASEVYVTCKTANDVAKAIKTMV